MSSSNTVEGRKSAPLRKRPRKETEEDGSKLVIGDEHRVDGAMEVDAQVLETEHVKKVYDSIASHWHGTRYKPWPKVEAFIKSQRKGTLFGDVGCGNGKNLPACNEVGVGFGCDFSIELMKIARERDLEVAAADGLDLPFRNDFFDCVLCIAVLHHISTPERRLQLIKECMRVVKKGGDALFYAWAMEQKFPGNGASTKQEGVSGHRFADSDNLVPWHFKTGDSSNAANLAPDLDHVKFDTEKQAYVFQRYCHVYKQGELEELLQPLAPEIEIKQVYWDTGNWALILHKND